MTGSFALLLAAMVVVAIALAGVLLVTFLSVRKPKRRTTEKDS